ncbi:MAG: peptidylprolyl isomerase [Erysipelotrichaceae bacterium]|nr:peptidylprolyl isomerase [Erysipelotrichaceae bacterium]
MKKVLKEYWLLMLIGALLLGGTVYFVIEDNSGKIAGKTENGNDVVFSIGEENITADEFYDSLYESYGSAGIYQFMLKAVAEASYETTSEMKELAELYAENVKANYMNQYGGEYEAYLTSDLQSMGYNSVDELDEYFVNYQKTNQFLIETVTDETDGTWNKYAEEKQPRIVSHILIKMADPENPTEEELAKVDAVNAALANGEEFGAVALAHSEDTSATANGLLGYADADTSYVEEFLKAMLTLKEGETTDWVKTQYGVHLIKCDSTSLETFIENYSEDMLNAVLTFDPSVQPRAVWAKAEEIGIEFTDETVKTNLMNYLGLESEAE